MGLRAGELNRRVTILRGGPDVDDGYTTKPGGFAPLATVRARVTYGTGVERRAAAQEQASAPATVRVRKSSVTATVTPQDRLLLDGVEWDISSAVPFENVAIDITATRPV